MPRWLGMMFCDYRKCKNRAKMMLQIGFYYKPKYFYLCNEHAKAIESGEELIIRYFLRVSGSEKWISMKEFSENSVVVPLNKYELKEIAAKGGS